MKGADIGVLLDAYHKARSREKSYVAASLASVGQTTALMTGLIKYRTNPVLKKYPKLKKVVGDLIAGVEEEQKRGLTAGTYATYVKQALASLQQAGRNFQPSAATNNSESNPYASFLALAKQVGVRLAILDDLDDSIHAIRLEWVTLATRKFSAGGAGGRETYPPGVQRLTVGQMLTLADSTSKKLAALKVI